MAAWFKAIQSRRSIQMFKPPTSRIKTFLEASVRRERGKSAEMGSYLIKIRLKMNEQKNITCPCSYHTQYTYSKANISSYIS